MFRDLQRGYSVNILDKSSGKINYYSGTVISRGEPRFDTKTFGQPMPTDRILDLTVEYNGKTQTYVVPENGNVASAPEITLACEPSYIMNEVQSLLKKSEDVIASIDTHKANIEECNTILGKINPSLGESQEYVKRLNEMDVKIDSINKALDRIVDSLQLKN